MIEKYPLYHHCHGHRHGHHHHHHQHHHQHEITPLHHPSSLFCIIFELKTAKEGQQMKDDDDDDDDDT